MKTKLFSNFSKTEKPRFSSLIKTGSNLLKQSMRYYSYRKLGFPAILPMVVRLSITNKCDSRCKMCHIWNYYKKHPDKLKEELTFDEFKKFVDINPFLQDLMLTGGQVTLRKDILDMWLYLDQKGYRTGGATNAVDLQKVKRVNLKALQKLSGKNKHLILISIDGLEKQHNYIRGVKNDFRNSIKLLDWALKKRNEFDFLDVQVATNITSTNYGEFPEFFNFMLNKGLNPLQISYRITMYSERFDNIKSNIIAEKKYYSEIFNILKELGEKYKEINNYYFRGTLKYLKNPRKLVVPCYAGYSVARIDPYWNVYACNDVTHIGNLRKTNMDLRKLWIGNKIKKVQRYVKSGKCSNCWNPCFAGPSIISDPFQIVKLATDYGSDYKKKVGLK